MISVRMLRDWEYDFVDQNDELATRKCPKNLVLEFEEEIAGAAVAAGAAETMAPHSANFAERVRVHKRYLDIVSENGGDADAAAEQLLEEETARAAEAAAEQASAKKGKAAKSEAEAKAKEEAEAAEAAAKAQTEAGVQAEADANAKEEAAEAAAKSKAKAGKR